MDSRQPSRKRKRKHLSIEMILRKSFVDCVKEYVKNCSLPGVRQMCDPKISVVQRLIWIIVVCAAITTCVYFLLYTWSDTLTKPLIITMASLTYPISEIDFPAVAICNMNRISKKALYKLAEEEYPDISRGETLEEVSNALLALGNLIDFSYNESMRNNLILRRFAEKYRSDPPKILDIMKKLTPDCNEMLIKCSWAGNTADCKGMFTTRRTDLGHCCTFNYVLDYENTNSKEQLTEEIKRQSEPGSFYGLNVIVDPMLDDYAYPIGAVEGLSVLIFSSTHYPETRSGRIVRIMSETNAILYLELKSTKQIATNEVRKYSLPTRGCLFHNEQKAEFANQYSYSTCLVLCRIQTIQSLCKCTPYTLAMKKPMKDNICSLEHLKCLNKYREKLMYLYPTNTDDTTGLEMELEDSIFCEQCWPDCELTQHFTKAYQISIKNYHEKAFKPMFTKDVNMTNKCGINVFHTVPYSTLEYLDVVYYWFEILSNIGGFCGMVIGFSVFSVAEVFYFLTVRLVQNFNKNLRIYH